MEPNGRVVTLCEECAKRFSRGYSVKKINFGTETQNLKFCEDCKHKNSTLAQYVISKKGGR